MDDSDDYTDSDEDIDEPDNYREFARCFKEIRRSFLTYRNLPAKLSNTKNYQNLLSPTNIFELPEDVFNIILDYLNLHDQLSLFLSSKRIMDIVRCCSTVHKKFFLKLNNHTIKNLTKYHEILSIPFRNIEINLEKISELNEIEIFFENFKPSVVKLTVKNRDFRVFDDFFKIVGNIPNLQLLSLENCNIEQLDNKILNVLSTLNAISLENCNENIYKALVNQRTIEKTTVINNDWSWNGFPHYIFNKIIENSKNHITSMIFKGLGTGSYFDCDEFPYKISKLETTMITFHWYVGIRTERVNFLRSQMGVLKELKIHQLPNDFNGGGRVLKFIFDHMNLENFHYGKTALILKGKKQQVRVIEVTNIQIQSLFELVEQFPSITTICMNLSVTNILSDETESIINRPTDLFKNILEFEVDDNSKYRSIFGVFLKLLKNLTNVRKLSLKIQDRNINCLLEEFLPYMNQLNEIYLTSTANRSRERFLIIRKFTPYLNKFSVAIQYEDEAKAVFGPSVEVCSIKNSI